MSRKGVSYCLALGLLTVLVGCGGDNIVQQKECPAGQTGTWPNCIDPPPPCTLSTVLNDQGGVGAKTIVFDDFSVPDTGRLDMVLDWTNAPSNVGLYLVPANTCSTIAEFNARSCNFLVRSEPPGAKPRKTSTANFTAGNYRYLIANFSDSQESVALQVSLAKGSSCPAAVDLPPSVSRANGVPLAIERLEKR